MCTFDEVCDDDCVTDAFASVFSNVALESHGVARLCFGILGWVGLACICWDVIAFDVVKVELGALRDVLCCGAYADATFDDFVALFDVLRGNFVA